MFHKVKEAFPLPGKRLSVIFADGTTKIYDVSPLLEKIEAFEQLEDEAVFSSVEVDVGGYGIVWSDDVDLSSEELWENGVAETPPAADSCTFSA